MLFGKLLFGKQVSQIKTKGEIMKMTQTVWVYHASNENIKSLLRQAGSNFGAVHFVKKTDGTLRKMCYKLGVHKNGGTSKIKRQSTSLMTVWDTNKQTKTSDGETIRGAYRSINLDGVTQITSGGTKYIIKTRI